jgi:hypothetical protein
MIKILQKFAVVYTKNANFLPNIFKNHNIGPRKQALKIYLRSFAGQVGHMKSFHLQILIIDSTMNVKKWTVFLPASANNFVTHSSKNSKLQIRRINKKSVCTQSGWCRLHLCKTFSGI